MVSFPLEIVPRSKEMVKLEWEKLGSQWGFDSYNFYLADCLARSVTDLLSTWSQEDWYSEGELSSLFFLCFFSSFFFLGDQEVSFNLSWTYLCLYPRSIIFFFLKKVSYVCREIAGFSWSVAQQKCLRLHVERDRGFASLSFSLSFLAGIKQEVPVGLNEKYQISSAYEKGPLEVVLQTDTRYPENQCQKLSGFLGFLCFYFVCRPEVRKCMVYFHEEDSDDFIFEYSFHFLHGKRFVLLSRV